MQNYVILTKLSPESVREPKELRALSSTISEKMKSECPGVRWLFSYACMGRFDIVDLVEADTPEDVERAAMIIRACGRATTETMLATPWKEFLANL